MTWEKRVVNVHSHRGDDVRPGDRLVLYHDSHGPEEEQVIVTRVFDDNTISVAAPTWWRRAYWWLVRLIWRAWRRP